MSTTSSKRRVFLVEDHPIVRHGLTMLIDEEHDLAVSGSADGIANAVSSIAATRPDVVVVDLTLGDGNGLDLIRDLRERFPELRLLTLSMHDESLYGERALRAGANGYVMKKEAMDKLIVALRRVLDGELYLSEKMASRLVNKLIDPASVTATSPVGTLSEREFQVFRLIADGIGPTEIGQRLGVSVKTIETHREHIKEKLGLKSGAELTRYTVQWRLEQPGE